MQRFWLNKKKFRKDSKLITFCFKLFPFIHNNYIKEYINTIKEFIEGKVKRFLKYYIFYEKLV